MPFKNPCQIKKGGEITNEKRKKRCKVSLSEMRKRGHSLCKKYVGALHGL